MGAMEDSRDIPLPMQPPMSLEEQSEILRVWFDCIMDRLDPAALRVLRAQCISHPRDAAADRKIIAAIDERLSQVTAFPPPGS